MNFRYVGPVADSLATGRPLSFGDVVDLTTADVAHSHNQLLIDEGRLIALPKAQRVNHSTKNEDKS